MSICLKLSLCCFDSVVSNSKNKPQKAVTKANDNSTHSTRFNTSLPALTLSRMYTLTCTIAVLIYYTSPLFLGMIKSTAVGTISVGNSFLKLGPKT